ncbi:MAG: hypothetical protein Q8L20_02415 [Gammaproteobacteria bacterium]|nr:hypothetical protein [Gammaproteobacteria bacterium]
METSNSIRQHASSSANPSSQVNTGRTIERAFYTGITVVLCAMVVIGFWPSYFSLVFGEPVVRPLIMHAHGAIFTGWMGLLALQVTLVAKSKVDAHRRVGKFGIAYGAVVLVLGTAVSFVAPALHVQSGNWPLDQAAGFMILPLGDMILFAGFFGAAVAKRSQSETHKRLMLAATVALVFAAVARMELAPPLLFFFVWISPLLLGMAFDLYRRKQIHKVYLISFAVFAVFFLRTLLMESEAWLSVARPMLRPFL